jgi:hypothetical protein
MPSDKLNTVGCKLFRNEGAGKYTDISADNGACPTAFGGRSATTLDYDGDGKLDLLVGEDPLTGYNGSPTKAARLFRNLGALQFADVSRAVGLPEQLPSLGVAVADVNNDTWPDIFLAAAKGGNRLFMNDAAGKFREVPTAANEAETKLPKGDHTHALCGVCFGDVNRDGWLDLVLGQHTKTPWVSPAANRLYLHGGLKNGVPEYADITEAAGLPALPMKAPHVELQDFDNDGWLDLYCSYVMYAPPVAAGMAATPQPVVFRNLGQSSGVQFKTSVLSLNDFPNDSDRAIKSTGTFFKKMVSEEKCLYVAAAPTADFNNDGKLDILFCSWWPERPSLLLQNETRGGNWLQVQVNGTGVLNRDGIGTRVKVYPAGKCGDAHALLGMQEIASGFGYASAQAPISHFGLGTHELVDLEIIWPHGKGRLEQRGVKVNQRLTLAN